MQWSFPTFLASNKDSGFTHLRRELSNSQQSTKACAILVGLVENKRVRAFIQLGSYRLYVHVKDESNEIKKQIMAINRESSRILAANCENFKGGPINMIKYPKLPCIHLRTVYKHRAGRDIYYPLEQLHIQTLPTSKDFFRSINHLLYPLAPRSQEEVNEGTTEVGMTQSSNESKEAHLWIDPREPIDLSNPSAHKEANVQ